MLERLSLTLAPTLLLVAPAFAQLNPEEQGSLIAGVSHPLFGADHILAMVAVSLWAARLGGHTLWQVSAAFVSAMAVGFAASISGAQLPFVEPAILASVVTICLAAAVALKVPTWVGIAIIGLFAFFHAYPHGGELSSADVLSFGVGFVLSTALLHATSVGLGFGIGRIFGGETDNIVTRIVGAATTFGGLWLALGA